MILEIANFSIRPDAVAPFETSFAAARQVIARAPGHLGHEMHRSVDAPGRYTLLVRWRSKEDHTIGFRQSELFKQWRGLLQEHFATPPVVDHLEALHDQDPSP